MEELNRGLIPLRAKSGTESSSPSTDSGSAETSSPSTDPGSAETAGTGDYPFWRAMVAIVFLLALLALFFAVLIGFGYGFYYLVVDSISVDGSKVMGLRWVVLFAFFLLSSSLATLLIFLFEGPALALILRGFDREASPKAKKTAKQVRVFLDGELPKEERSLALIENDHINRDANLAFSVCVLLLSLLASFQLIVNTAVLSLIEPLVSIVLVGSFFTSLTVLVWLTHLDAKVDKLISLFLFGLPFMLLFVIYPLNPMSITCFPCILAIVFVLHTLFFGRTFFSIPRSRPMVLTSAGIRFLSYGWQLAWPPFAPQNVSPPRSIDHIHVSPGPWGGRWSLHFADGSSEEIIPSLLDSSALKSFAKGQGMEIEIRGEDRLRRFSETASQLGKKGWIVLALWIVWFSTILTPCYHLTLFLRLDLLPKSESIIKEPKKLEAVSRACCRHHPLALNPHAFVIASLLFDGRHEEARAFLEDFKEGLSWLPQAVAKNWRLGKTNMLLCAEEELELNERFESSKPLTWEPRGEQYSLYRRAMLSLFSTWSSEGFNSDGGRRRSSLERAGELLKRLGNEAPQSQAVTFMRAYWELIATAKRLSPEKKGHVSELPSLAKLSKSMDESHERALAILSNSSKNGQWREAAELMGRFGYRPRDRTIFICLLREYFLEKDESSVERAINLVIRAQSTISARRLYFRKLAMEPPRNARELKEFLEQQLPSKKEAETEAIADTTAKGVRDNFIPWSELAELGRGDEPDNGDEPGTGDELGNGDEPGNGDELATWLRKQASKRASYWDFPKGLEPYLEKKRH